MWVCDDCGATFNEPAFYKEIHMELDDHPAEMISCCPECGGGFWSEAGECKYCEEWFPIDRLVAGKFCDKCMERILEEHPDIVEAYCRSDLTAFAEFAAEALCV